MLRKFHYGVYLLLVILPLTGCSYTKNLNVLTRKQAIEDLDYLVTNVKAVHPEPFTSISEDDFYGHVKKVKSAFGKKVRRHNELAPAVAEMLALMDDSHTRLNRLFPDYSVYEKHKHRLMPLALRYKNGDVIVADWAKTVTPVNLKKGDVVVSINGNSIAEWLEKYYKYFSAETIEQKQWAIPPLLPACILMSEGHVENFEVTLRNEQGRIYKENLPAALPEFLDEQQNAKWGEFPFEFHFDGQLCHFQVSSFADAYREKYFRVLDTLLRELKQEGTSILVVDLRGNGGGHGGLGYELLRRVTPEPFRTGCKRWRYSRAYERNYIIAGLMQRKIPPWLLLDRWLRLHWFYGKYHHIYANLSQLEGEYIDGCKGEGGLIPPKSDHWSGTLAVIVDHGTASPATDFAAIVKDNRLGLLVGEETGGRASYFAEVCPVYLPNSGLESVISSAHFLRPDGYDDGRGVLPDLPLDVTLEDSVLVEKVYDYVR